MCEKNNLFGNKNDILDNRTKHFIEKSINKHKNLYDYTNVEYINAKTKIKIGCKLHGLFEQTPDKHLNTTYCCPKCNLIRKTDILNKKKGVKKIKPHNKYVESLLKKYPEIRFEIIGEWSGVMKTNVLVFCEKHNNVETSCYSLLSKQRIYPCLRCSEENRVKNKCLSIDDIINRLEQKYNYRYKYIFPNEYKNKKTKITIDCPIHGEFKRSVQKLLNGQHCSKCKLEKLIDDNILVGGYNEKLFEKKPIIKEKKCYLYYLRINNGNLFKIGISVNDPKCRIKSLKSRSKHYIKTCDIVMVKELTLYDAFILEQKILSENKEHRIKRKWSTELFDKDIYKNISQYFNSYLLEPNID
jgi:hypothetical protein